MERRQIKLDLVIVHQGQCPHQVSLNLANLDFQGLTRFLSQGLLIEKRTLMASFPLSRKQRESESLAEVQFLI